MIDGPEGEDLVEWLRWLDERPARVREVASRLPPRTYRLEGTRAPVTIATYDELVDVGVDPSRLSEVKS